MEQGSLPERYLSRSVIKHTKMEFEAFGIGSSWKRLCEPAWKRKCRWHR